ncbi:prohibitin family protein [Arthrobacter sp. KNU40]|uniref:prohibitin family protein n=1 Tax=Arthrobacter sp. KNU40 TaxID=3447965 RepID=UPI003F62D286
MDWKEQQRAAQQRLRVNIIRGSVAGVLALCGIITLFSSMEAVGTGEVGVVTSYGRVTGRELDEGFSWIAPWGVNSATIYDVKTQKDQIDATGATADLQDVQATLVLNYALNRGEVSNIHKTVGKEYKDKLVIPALNETFKAAAARYVAGDLITKRAEVKNDVTKQLSDRLKKYGISIQDVSITNFSFSPEFSAAIEAKQVAQQNAEKAEQDLARIKVEADQAITKARGEAEAQRLQQETLTQELLQKLAIEKWDGKLPTTSAGTGTLFTLPLK